MIAPANERVTLEELLIESDKIILNLKPKIEGEELQKSDDQHQISQNSPIVNSLSIESS